MRRTRRPDWRRLPGLPLSRQRWLLFLIAGFAGGCQWVFGDFEMAERGPNVGVGGQSSTTGGAGGAAFDCPQGRDFYCNLGVLIDCKSGESTNCGGEGLCRADPGGCLQCSQGDRRCSGNILETCTADNTWEAQQDCSETQEPVCDPEAKKCALCLRQTTKCDGATLLTCNTKGDAYAATPCVTTYDPQGCVEDVAGQAHCVVCAEATFVRSCSDGIRRDCVKGEIARTICPNGCATGTAGGAVDCL